MKITNTYEAITDEQAALLSVVRKNRRFNVHQYIELKVDLINKYMEKAGLKAAVVGMSGGIDSAVVMALLNRAALKSNIRVLAVSLPSNSNRGVVDQMQGENYSRRVAREHDVEFTSIDINDAVTEIAYKVENSLKMEKTSDWAYGQLSPYTRTPFLYYVATVLKEQGFPAIIVGTTNRDEGSYLGYVGKASDGMVDVQLISDLHKSEVRRVAKHLGVTNEIVQAIPKGDMFDGKTDEEIFGAAYDFVELYMTNRVQCQAAENLEKVHNYNAHKYLVGSPAVHLDIYESGVAGGWPLQFESAYWKKLHDRGDYIAPNFVSPLPFTKIKFDADVKATRTGDLEFQGILSDNEIEQLKTMYQNGQKKDANVFGYTKDVSKKGSSRATLYNVDLAEVLWNRLRPSLDILQQANDPITDWKKGEIYRMVGVSPLFRFIGYSDAGTLVPHYDYAFEKDGDKTLFSVVLYLTTNKTGATRFIPDEQAYSWDKNLADWSVERADTVTNDQCVNFYPKAGNAVVFPHHMLHDSETVVGEEKLIIRTDIVCQKIKHS